MKQKYISKLINESVVTSDNSVGRPSLLALTRATTKMVYQDLVAVQRTSQPVAALFGVKYLNADGQLSFASGSTFSGEISEVERATLPVLTTGNAGSIAKDGMFIYNSVTFKSLVASPFSGGGTTVDDMMLIALATNSVRTMSNAAVTSKFEAAKPNITDAKFQVNRWNADVKSRKFKTELTVELAQDMESAGFDAPSTIEDMLATQMAEEINKDIMQSLITVSKRFTLDGVTTNGYLDLSTSTDSSYVQGRSLYYYICEMVAYIQRNTSYSATYVLASSRAAALLASSGWMKQHDDQPLAAYGVLKNGLVVYVDNNSPVEYVIAGVKDYYGDNELVGSLFYAPYSVYEEGDPEEHIGAFTVINDYESLQPHVALMVRYALSVNPYTMGLTDDQARVIDSTDLDNFVGQSQMSMYLGLKLPATVN